MGAVLFSVGGIDQFEHGRVGLSGRRDTVRAAAVPVRSAHVDVTAGADDPDRSRLLRRRVAAARRNLDLRDCP